MGSVSMLEVCVAVIFSLVSVSQTAPAKACETIVKPLDIKNVDPMIGKWSLISMSSNRPGIRTWNELFTESIWWDLSPGTSSNMLNAKVYMKLVDECYSKNSNLTLKDNMIIFDYVVPSTAVLLQACHDCLVTQTTTTIHGNVHTTLKLLSKRRVLTDAELLQFDTQVECLKLPPRYTADGDEDLCSDTSKLLPDTENIHKAVMDFMEIDAVKKTLIKTDRFFEKHSAAVIEYIERFGEYLEKVGDWISSFM